MGATVQDSDGKERVTRHARKRKSQFRERAPQGTEAGWSRGRYRIHAGKVPGVDDGIVISR